MPYAQHKICPREWQTHTPLEFWHTNKSSNLGQTTRPYDNQQKKRELAKLWILLSQLTHRIKLKENLNPCKRLSPNAGVKNSLGVANNNNNNNDNNNKASYPRDDIDRLYDHLISARRRYLAIVIKKWRTY